MTERGIDTSIWGHREVQPLKPYGKLLYAYLWTNPYCNQAGLYEITMRTIEFDTGIPIKQIPELLETLEPLKIIYYLDKELVWVKNFLKRQCHNASFLQAALKSLGKTTTDKDLIDQYYAYNNTMLTQWGHGGNMVATPVQVRSVQNRSEQTRTVNSPRGRKEASSPISEILKEMRSYYDYPDKLKEDPIPNYGAEGNHIKRMLTRGYTKENILGLWKSKVDQRHEFVSMHWVNMDIGNGVIAESKGGTSDITKRIVERNQQRRREMGKPVAELTEEEMKGSA